MARRARSRVAAPRAARARAARRTPLVDDGFPCARCGRPLRRDASGLRSRRPRTIACPRCRFLLYDYPRPCAGVVVLKGDDVLMLRRGAAPRRGCLDIPGGFMEEGERIDGAARRELQEETGLRVGRLDWLGFYWDHYFIRGFGYFPTMNFYYLARWKSGVPLGADDAASAEWIPLAKLGGPKQRLAWRHMRQVFKDVRRFKAGRRRRAAGF